MDRDPPAAARERLARAQARLVAGQGTWEDHLAAGEALELLGQEDAAAAALDRAAAGAPETRAGAAAWRALGLARARRGQPVRARRALERVVALAPDDAEIWLRLGIMDFKADRIRAAEAPLARAVALAPADPRAAAALASVCLRTDRVAEALDLLAPWRDDPAPPAPVAANLATALARQGRPALALPAVDGALARTPGDPVLWHARGSLLDDLGRVDEAFAAFDQANRQQPGTWSAEDHHQRVEAVVAAWDARALRTSARSTGDGRGVVLVVGMPRSGTSLLEQALACHPDIAGGGELDRLRPLSLRLSRALGAGSRWFDQPRRVTAAVYDQLAQAYLASLAAAAGPGLLRIDKTPDNFLHLGLATLVLPGVRVVHIQRDPVDTCWSCFRQPFGPGLAWSQDLDALGRYHADYRRLMDHWRAVLPTPPLELRYEDLVAHPEPTLRALLAALGRPWSPAVLRSHESERLVVTASHTQVRAPIHTRAVGRARAYARHLGPLWRWLPAG